MGRVNRPTTLGRFPIIYRTLAMSSLQPVPEEETKPEWQKPVNSNLQRARVTKQNNKNIYHSGFSLFSFFFVILHL